MDEITARLSRIDELTADELTQLEADIIAARDELRAAGPGDTETGAQYIEALTSLHDARRLVSERITTIASEVAEAERLLADLDAEFAAIGVDADELAPLAELSDDDRQALVDLDEDGRTALAELVTASDDPALAELAELSEADLAAVAEWAEAVADPGATVTEITPPPAPEAPAPESDEQVAARAAAALRHLPRPRQPQPAASRAAAAVAYSYDTERPLTEEQVAREILRAATSYGRVPGREVRVASLHLGDDVPRPADGETAEEFFDRQLDELRAHRTASATTRQASGPICAPAYVDYALLTLGTEDQPIGSLFPRGGGVGADAMKTLSFFQALTVEDAGITDGEGRGSATATENALALENEASPYPKTPRRVACPTPVSCEQRAVWSYLLFDNLASMAWPEFVAAVQQLARFDLAREKEEWRLEDWYQAADAANLVFTPAAQAYGANHSVLSTILSLVTHDRANKGDRNAPYVAAIPFWLESALATETLAMLDVASGSMSIEDARREILARHNITVTSYLTAFGKSAEANVTDGGFDTVLGDLANAGTVPALGPCEARIGVARDDAAFDRMGDELNLGVLRTDDDLANNDHRFFEEGWDRLCFRIPPMVADVLVDPNGATAPSEEALAVVCEGS